MCCNNRESLPGEDDDDDDDDDAGDVNMQYTSYRR